MKRADFKALAVGDTSELTRTIRAEDIVTFADVTGDVNPVHLDEAFARETRFGGCIAHGMLTAALISAVLGTQLPGPGAVYVSQSLNFRRPVRAGDAITAKVEVVELMPDKGFVRLTTTCTNADGKTVLDGEALMFVESSGSEADH